MKREGDWLGRETCHALGEGKGGERMGEGGVPVVATEKRHVDFELRQL